MQDFRLEAPENGAKGAVLEHLCDFSTKLFLKNGIWNKKQKIGHMGLEFFSESDLGKYHRKVFRKVRKLLETSLKLLLIG